LDIYKDPLCGWGVRAREQILPGTFVINYWGELLGEIETAKRCLIYDKVVSTYVLGEYTRLALLFIHPLHLI